MKSFNILALDENFQIIGIVAFINLQWSRKFHESGTFSLSVPLGQYKSNWKYIYTPDRKEVGEITQINYVSKDGFQQMYLSGYFLEEELNKMIVHPFTRYTYDEQFPSYNDQTYPNAIVATNYPSWVTQEGKADVVAHAYFNAFKSISFVNLLMDNPTSKVKKTFSLDILDGTSEQGSYKSTKDTRNGEYLGEKIYSILKPSGASYRVRFDFTSGKKYFDVTIGKDRTEENGKNNPIIFSTKYGNIINPNILISNNDYKDCMIQGLTSTHKEIYGIYEKEPPSIEVFSVIPNASTNSKGNFFYKEGNINLNDYQAELGWTTYMQTVASDSLNELENRGTVINVDFDAIEGSYEYMVDFDLGDLVSIEIPEIDFSADARLIGCYETIESGVWNLSLEFGTPIIKNR